MTETSPSQSRIAATQHAWNPVGFVGTVLKKTVEKVIAGGLAISDTVFFVLLSIIR